MYELPRQLQTSTLAQPRAIGIGCSPMLLIRRPPSKRSSGDADDEYAHSRLCRSVTENTGSADYDYDIDDDEQR
jgi:hypothetical protein